MQGKITRPRVVRVGIYAAVLLFFALCPLSAVQGGIFRCPSTLLGGQCPGCGVTRALVCLMKGDFSSAFAFNAAFTAVIFPCLLLLALQDVFVILTRRKMSVVEYIWRGGKK